MTARYERQQKIRQQTKFGMLPAPRRRGRAFVISIFVNSFAMVLFIVVSLAHFPQEKQQTADSINLTFETPVYKLPRPKLPRIRSTSPQTKSMANSQTATSTANLKTPKLALATGSVAIPRQVRVGSFATATAAVAANHNTARFIEVGAFGNPMGVRANPSARESGLQAPMLGSFGGVPGATGPGAGAGRRGGGGAGGVRLVGFGAGFGDGGGTGTTGTRGSGSESQPVTVTAGVRPVYTPEARAAHVEGEVVLRVRFTASGQIEILGVVQPLGHGLDQSAENAVRQYRFIPATRNGQPVDQTTTVHVHFQLAA